jgi:hypothetical protein
MPKPMAICIEDLDPESEASRYIRCVAVGGRQPGLRLDEAGRVLWQREDVVSCELWVSADERLILYRQADMAPVTLRRAGRSLDVPCGKPVVIIDKDQIDVGSRHLRVHVHGEASSVAAPSALLARPRPFDRVTHAVAAAAMIGTVAAAASCAAPTIEVRVAPPEVVVPVTPTSATSAYLDSVERVIQGDWTLAQAFDVEGETVSITGTLTIAGDRYTFRPAPGAEGVSVEGHLGFLFDAPEGEVTIGYPDGVTPDAALAGFAPGDILAGCVFRADSGTMGEFQIQVWDADHLRFADQSGDGGTDWSITKPLSAGD